MSEEGSMLIGVDTDYTIVGKAGLTETNRCKLNVFEQMVVKSSSHYGPHGLKSTVSHSTVTVRISLLYVSSLNPVCAIVLGLTKTSALFRVLPVDLTILLHYSTALCYHPASPRTIILFY